MNVPLVVKGLTAVGLCCLLLGKANAQTWEKNNPIIHIDSLPTIFYSVILHFQNRLDQQTLKSHRLAFWHAVNHAETGKITRWDDQYSIGQIRVTATYIVGDGHCRFVESNIQHNHKNYSFEDFLCWSETTKSWTLRNKY